MSRTRSKKASPRGAKLFAAMVEAVRAYVAEVNPATDFAGESVNLIDITAFSTGGCGVATIAKFHADPTDSDREHDQCDGGDGTARHCSHCRGDRRAKGGAG